MVDWSYNLLCYLSQKYESHLIITIINVIYLLVTIYRIYTVGWDEIQEQFRQAMEQYEAQQAAQ